MMVFPLFTIDLTLPELYG